jgi:hypothetical protein
MALRVGRPIIGVGMAIVRVGRLEAGCTANLEGSVLPREDLNKQLAIVTRDGRLVRPAWRNLGCPEPQRVTIERDADCCAYRCPALRQHCRLFLFENIRVRFR